MFPEHLHPVLPHLAQLPSGAAHFNPMEGLKAIAQQLLPSLPSLLAHFHPTLGPNPFHFFGQQPAPAPLPHPNMIRVIKRPPFVAHECFNDAVHLCREKFQMEHQTRACMMDNFAHLQPECQKELTEHPTLMEACFGQIQHYCNNDRYSCERVMDCMVSHQTDIAHDPSAAKCLPFVNILAQRMGTKAIPLSPAVVIKAAPHVEAPRAVVKPQKVILESPQDLQPAHPVQIEAPAADLKPVQPQPVVLPVSACTVNSCPSTDVA